MSKEVPGGLPDPGLPDVAEKLDRAAAQRGLSRDACVVEVLTERVRAASPMATAAGSPQPRNSPDDLGDSDLMRSAWL
jgi:hypothetical protein